MRWYLQYPLSHQHVTQLVAERGVEVDASCIWRWVQAYAPELNKRCRPHLKPTNKSYRIDETYINVKGEDTYLYRALDSTGQTIDFLLTAKRGRIGVTTETLVMHVNLNDPSDFTLDNIRSLIASGDDTVDNQVRVTRSGLALLSQIVGSDALDGFALRLETSLANQGRVGVIAARNDRLVGRIYRSLQENWPNHGKSYIGQF